MLNILDKIKDNCRIQPEFAHPIVSKSILFITGYNRFIFSIIFALILFLNLSIGGQPLNIILFAKSEYNNVPIHPPLFPIKNIYFYAKLIQTSREAIRENRFSKFREDFLKKYQSETT